MTFRAFMAENGYNVQTTFWEDSQRPTFSGYQPFRTLSTVPLKSGKATASTLRNWYWC